MKYQKKIFHSTPPTVDVSDKKKQTERKKSFDVK